VSFSHSAIFTTHDNLLLNYLILWQVSREIQLHTNLIHDSVIAMYAAWKDSSHVDMAIEWAAGVRDV
jgi:hypothetical protein